MASIIVAQQGEPSDSELSDHFDALPLRSIHPQTPDSCDAALFNGQEDQEVADPQNIPVSGPTDTVIPRPHGVSNIPQQTRSQYAALPNEDVIEEADYDPHPTESSTGDLTSVNKLFWRPSTLRWPVLLSTLIVALVLGLGVIFLLVYSAANDGLGPDDGSAAVLFGWRFVPTLVTVLYAILTTMTFNDARRTEPFAQMSHVLGASSASSVFKKPEQWWSILGNSLRKHKNHGSPNYLLPVAVLVNVISSLLINTLSSALLQSQLVELVSHVPFTRYGISQDQPIRMAANDLIYFRTIGSILQNLTTSAWLTDRYAVVPFSPSSDSVNLGTAVTDRAQQWQSNATVLSLELNCEKMNIHSSIWSKSLDFHSLLLTDTHGCEAGINGYSQYLTKSGGGSWFAPPNFTVPVWDDGNDEGALYYNSTQQCNGRQIILSTNGPWQGETINSWNEFFKAAAWSCQTTYYAATMPVTASTAANGTILEINDAAFDAGRSLLQNTILDQTSFDAAFLDKNWTSMLYTANPTGQANFGGVSALLAALYDFDPARMIDADSVAENARRIKQHFLGEMVLATVTDNKPILQAGQVIDTQRRVVVNLPIGISLAVLFIISAGLVAAAWFLSIRRPLNLHNDPSSVAAVVKLIDGNTLIQGCSKTLDPDKVGGLYERLGSTRHFLLDGSLSSIKSLAENSENDNTPHMPSRDWRPFAVRRLGGLLLLLLLALIFAGILTLFILASTTGLYESAFTYRTDLALSSTHLFTLAPYSIVPTFLAVAVSLWWDSLDETFRRLQPYVAMAQKAVPASPNIGLSYLSTYSIGSVAKALWRRHWLVTVVSGGGVLAQVLTVSMSALWQRTDGSRPGDMNLIRNLEPRTQPFEYIYLVGNAMGGGDPTGQTTLSSFYGNLSTNWLYSATMQLVYNGSEPAWSRDGWSFVPVNLSSIVDSHIYKKTPSVNTSTSSAGSGSLKSVNVTLTTPAVRATMECSSIESANNPSNWATEWDLTDPSVWNVSVNPTGLQKGFGINMQMELGQDAAFSTTPILSRERTLLCCLNLSSTAGGSSAIGYWSINYKQGQVYDFESDSGPYPRNLTIKWIRGTAVQQYYLMNSSYEFSRGEGEDFRRLIWQEAPKMSALNCQPRIQWTNASVTVDMTTGQVWQYIIADTPEAFDWPWSDVYLPHKYSGPGDDPAAGNFHDQITVSYGVLFQDALLFASDLQILWPSGGSMDSQVEDLNDKNFNIRLPQQGLNTDLMSYSMYQLANGDLDVLMDPTQMAALGGKVFTTFFQHFISASVTPSGGWGFQKIGSTLAPDLGPALDSIGSSVLSTYQDQNTSLTSDTRVPVHVEIEVEVLQMSPAAVYVSLSILFVLGLITLLVYLLGYRYFRHLRHDFDNLASVVALVYDSPKLQAWVRTHPDPRQWGGSLRTSGVAADMPLVRLGTFIGTAGHERWGIEIVDEGVDEKKCRQL
ncbi:uncharacterized protein PV07_09894 [Cladophialophora immunda]|uniref:Uncharacterized protein n=1 Tax=Cladophialophora immunda TaxID=569365 RepID=A0A0D2CKT9_9EURO|nr:uncharacterized protein PV07_09894 [Cladophialophora immunda]KIW24164.1 hypothetical protein PV07_09894 [Cladophialophora immunda]OQV05315.1 hypothetical protein CLAIMM_10077 [Cladophialophora immunda]